MNLQPAAARAMEVVDFSCRLCGASRLHLYTLGNQGGFKYCKCPTCRLLGRLLDIGSGTGRLLYLAKRTGWNVTGLELSTAIAEYSSRRTGVQVFVAHFLEFAPDPLLGTTSFRSGTCSSIYRTPFSQ